MNATVKIALEEPSVCEKPESLNFITCTAALPLSSFLLLEQIKRTLLLESSMSSTYITRWICGNVEGGTYRNSFDPEESGTEFLTRAQWSRLSWCLLVVIPFLWSWRNGNTAPYHPPPITFWPPTFSSLLLLFNHTGHPWVNLAHSCPGASAFEVPLPDMVFPCYRKRHMGSEKLSTLTTWLKPMKTSITFFQGSHSFFWLKYS